MSNLVEKLQSAETGSRGLDAEVEVSVRWIEAARVGLAPEHPAKWRASASGIVGDPNTQYPSSAVTTSLDAAIALAERILPGWWFTVGRCGLTSHASVGPDSAFVSEPTLSLYDAGFDADIRNPSTPAIALCVAVLRAHEAIQAKGGGETP